MTERRALCLISERNGRGSGLIDSMSADKDGREIIVDIQERLPISAQYEAHVAFLWPFITPSVASL